MRKLAIGTAFILSCFIGLRSENLTIYTGYSPTDARFVGVSLGDDVFPFLNLYLDIHKYTRPDQSLYSDIATENRGDFLGLSMNLALKFPIHLIPHLDRLDFIMPFMLVGYGVGLENLSPDYHALPTIDGNEGMFSKARPYNLFGAGLIVMITPAFGVKAEFRSLNIKELEGMALLERSIKRFSFGICFGKKPKKNVALSR